MRGELLLGVAAHDLAEARNEPAALFHAYAVGPEARIGGEKLWGNSKVNSGGGLWYPPSVDSQGRVFLGVANPAPWPGNAKYPNGSSRPGPNLYTNSLVALDGDTGKVLWYQQVSPHDLRDYDFQISPIITTLNVGGTQTEAVIGAGKSGKVIAFRADNGKRLWTRNVGLHSNDSGPLPAKKAVAYCPGALGGVETPMALAGGMVFAPWVDLCFKGTSSNGFVGGLDISKGKGRFGFLETKYHLPERIQDAIHKGGAKKVLGLSGTAISITKSVISIVLGIITIAFLTFFMLLEGPKWIERFYGLLPPESRPRWENVCNQIYRTVGGYVTGFVLSVILTAANADETLSNSSTRGIAAAAMHAFISEPPDMSAR